ncbi:MAG: SprB repeat-containing protein, partial [Crocinitomicaceae bacterium]|nr:SprB repeat-containing protein [Crocinitomicaceae bacterium]
MKRTFQFLFWVSMIVYSNQSVAQCPTVTETITDESCTGACDGEIQIDITAGTGPYTVEWFDGGGTSLGVITGVVATETITGLCSGNYSVDVTSAGGAGSTTIWTEDFESGINGWTLNVPTGVNGADNNYWEIDDDEAGMPAGVCGSAGNGDESMHITSVFNPAGGAAYDAGGLCGILFCPQANVRAESPNISTIGATGLTLNFVFIGNGDGLLDNASLWYNDGGGWVQLDPSLKSNMCAFQGQWTAYSVALPASCENIANLQIGFNWTNNDDGVGSDPSFAVDDIEIVSASGGPGCTTNEAYVVGSAGPCACPITITETITDESCPTVCDGEILIDIANGSGPYDVEWFDGGGTSIGTSTGVVAQDNITGLCPGNYSVEVTEAGGGGGGGPATVWTEGFDSGINGWTLNVPTGVNGADNNYWEIDDDESGLPAGTCGAAGMGSPSMHITSVFFPGGGAAYDAGGLCGILFCPEANVRAESPNISTVGFTGLTLNFDFIGNGDGMNDNASLWYNDGGGWTLLDPSLKSALCGVQGLWTAYSIALPASCDNIANLQIGFNWTNNDDGVGSDPSFAVHNIEIVSTTSGGGGSGCTQTANFTINAGVNPTISNEASTNITNCTAPDGSITITANGDSYELFTSGGASVTTNTTGSFTGLSAGDYYVEVSLNGCITTSSTFTISNASAPAAPNALADATYCVGDVMADLSVTGTGGTFTWYSDAGLTTVLGTGGTLTPGTTQGATIYYV